jgi:hypothetical protein
MPAKVACVSRGCVKICVGAASPLGNTTCSDQEIVDDMSWRLAFAIPIDGRNIARHAAFSCSFISP